MMKRPKSGLPHNTPRSSSASTEYAALGKELLAMANSKAIARYDPFIGLVVHRESGATICLHCRKAYLLSSIVEHFITSHKLAVFMKKYNMVVFNENDKIIPDRMESQLLELGAKRFIDHGFYIAPTQDPLPVIDALKIERGYMCNYCPVFGQTSTAYFSPNLSTMNDHFSKVHAGMSNNQYTPCYIQHLYQDRDHLRYFRVECLDQEPIIPRIITTTDLGQDNPQYYGSKRPFSSMVSGTPVQNLCYKKSSLYDLIKEACGVDTTENRILLHDWVNNLYKKHKDHHIWFDNLLQKLVRAYFRYIQDALIDSSLSIDYERCKVMHDDSNGPLPTEGLNALPPKSGKRYFDLWFNYVKSVVLGTTASFGSHRSGAFFTTFGDKMLANSIKQITIAFLSDMLGLFDASTTDDTLMIRLAFPYIHAYFIQLLPKRVPGTMLMHSSFLPVFTAFKQINYLGQWNAVKQIPVMLEYCIRCITLADMLIQRDDLQLDRYLLFDEEENDTDQEQENLLI